MADKNIQVRLNKDLKEQFKMLCEKNNISMNKAISNFIKHYVKTNGECPEGMLNRVRNYPSDNLVRGAFYTEIELRKNFKRVCEENGGWQMTDIILSFMDYCISYDCFPSYDD